MSQAYLQSSGFSPEILGRNAQDTAFKSYASLEILRPTQGLRMTSILLVVISDSVKNPREFSILRYTQPS